MLFNFYDYFNNKTNSKELSDNDICRIAAYFTQNGKCYVTGKQLLIGQRELHHRKPRQFGGTDVPENLILLNKTVHLLVHAESYREFNNLLVNFPIDNHDLKMINQLRYEAHRFPIKSIAIA